MICFHNPKEPYGWLSNWYLSDFIVDEIKYSSMEQYMMHQKAILFHDKEIAEKILEISGCGKIKALGRQVHNFDDKIWIANREAIIIKGLTAKFTQNEKLKKMLLKTGNEILAECAVHDRIWGIGLSMHDSKRFHQAEWQGQNLLGKCLMEARLNIQKENSL